MLEVGLAPVRRAKKQKWEKQGHKKHLVTAKHMVWCVYARTCMCMPICRGQRTALDVILKNIVYFP